MAVLLGTRTLLGAQRGRLQRLIIRFRSWLSVRAYGVFLFLWFSHLFRVNLGQPVTSADLRVLESCWNLVCSSFFLVAMPLSLVSYQILLVRWRCFCGFATCRVLRPAWYGGLTEILQLSKHSSFWIALLWSLALGFDELVKPWRNGLENMQQCFWREHIK